MNPLFAGFALFLLSPSWAAPAAMFEAERLCFVSPQTLGGKHFAQWIALTLTHEPRRLVSHHTEILPNGKTDDTVCFKGENFGVFSEVTYNVRIIELSSKHYCDYPVLHFVETDSLRKLEGATHIQHEVKSVTPTLDVPSRHCGSIQQTIGFKYQLIRHLGNDGTQYYVHGYLSGLPRDFYRRIESKSGDYYEVDKLFFTDTDDSYSFIWKGKWGEGFSQVSANEVVKHNYNVIERSYIGD
jgi:hypothetical protein